MKKQTFKKSILGLSLAAVVGLGGTFAFLTATTGEKVNNFTSDNKIEGKTIEEFDEQTAGNYVPGDLIHKQPSVSIEEDSEKAWVALKVEYIDSKGNVLPYEDFSKLATVDDMDTTNWIKQANIGNAELYVFKNIVNPGEQATPLFTQTTVNAGIKTLSKEKNKTVYTYDAEGNLVSTAYTNLNAKTTVYDADGNVLGEFDSFDADTGELTTKLPSFQIKITGYAVQAENVDFATAQTQLADLAK